MNNHNYERVNQMIQVKLTDKEASIIGTILVKKMNYKSSFVLDNFSDLINGNEKNILYWVDKIPLNKVNENNINKEIKSIKNKLNEIILFQY